MNELRTALERIWEFSSHCFLLSWEANCILGCIKGSVSDSLRKVVLALRFAPTRTHLEYFIQLWAAQYKRDIDLLE